MYLYFGFSISGELCTALFEGSVGPATIGGQQLTIGTQYITTDRKQIDNRATIGTDNRQTKCRAIGKQWIDNRWTIRRQQVDNRYTMGRQEQRFCNVRGEAPRYDSSQY